MRKEIAHFYKYITAQGKKVEVLSWKGKDMLKGSFGGDGMYKKQLTTDN